jgi:hypothetical protein
LPSSSTSKNPSDYSTQRLYTSTDPCAPPKYGSAMGSRRERVVGKGEKEGKRDILADEVGGRRGEDVAEVDVDGGECWGGVEGWTDRGLTLTCSRPGRGTGRP